ncbi:hypothetical protein [Streptomyces sp. NPDC086989]|uniref:hypothetical protein n=1 Tax=Streptomyces sp. NPDC086989 TaxID=3365764 RepID=UPI00381DBEE0
MAGNSSGGSTAVAAMAADPRIAPEPTRTAGCSRRRRQPATGIRSRHRRPSGDPNGKRLDGRQRWITFDDSNHCTFTDRPAASARPGCLRRRRCRVPVGPT